MSRRGPQLPRFLLDQVQGGRVAKSRQRPPQSRNDQRKFERQTKKFKSASTSAAESASALRPATSSRPARKDTLILSPPLKPAKEGNSERSTPKQRERQALRREAAPVTSRALKSRLEQDDAVIADLEKRLGLTRRKSKKTGDDELDWLAYGSVDEEETSAHGRRQPEDDAWLRRKRRKAAGVLLEASGTDDEASEYTASDSNLSEIPDEDQSEALLEDDEMDDDDELGPDKGDSPMDEINDLGREPETKRKKAKEHRENPYIAPSVTPSDAASVKYVPPSMRKPVASGDDEELIKRLRRQLQGCLNRLSEGNMLSILQSVHDIYTKNPRQHVTSTLIELLRERVCDPSVLNVTFLILHAGFATALYWTTGAGFGAQLLETLVNTFDSHHRQQRLNKDEDQTLAQGKQTLNLMAFLSHFYVLHAISSEIIFDYLRMLLDRNNFSEANTELLLRIVGIAGPQLRQEDPMALKDVILLLQRTVSTVGENNVSVRTKFMIETIHSLKNNRMKAGVAASALAAEHTQRMRKTLGSIKQSSKTVEPLRIGLGDIRNSDQKGKWWLVGASWRDQAQTASAESPASVEPAKPKRATDHGEKSDSDIDLDQVAREHGMNTEVRRAIFVAVTGAVDYQHARLRLIKLNLKSKQQLEIPRVLLHCVGAEPVYNHFYSLVATQFCEDHKLRKAYFFALLDLFRTMGEEGANSDIEADEPGPEAEPVSVRKVHHIAKLYATLVSDGLLRLTILKPLDFANLQARTEAFLKVLLSTVFVLLRKKTITKPKAHREEMHERLVKETFAHARDAPDLMAGLRYFLSTEFAAVEVAANKKEESVMAKGCGYAIVGFDEAGKIISQPNGSGDSE